MEIPALSDIAAAGFASFCLLTFIVIILFVLLAYIKKKKNFILFEKDVMINSQQADLYLKKIRSLSIRIGLSAIMVMFVILFAVLFSLSFIYDFFNQYMWIVFFLFIIYYIAHMFYSVFHYNKLNDLDFEEYKFIYDFSEDICNKYKLKMPKIKLFPDVSINACTISFFGKKSVIAINFGLLDLYHKGILSENQVKAIVGHEFGHIINHDVTVNTLLIPLINFVNALKKSIRWILVTLVNIMKFIVESALDSGSIIMILLSLGIALGILIVLLFVGIFFVIFWFLASAVDFFFKLYIRQAEYSSDLFGSIVIHSPTVMATALMNLSREDGLSELKNMLAVDIIKKKYRQGLISLSQVYNPRYQKKEINNINIHQIVNTNPNLINKVTIADSKYLLKKRKLGRFNEEDCEQYSKLKIGFMDSLRALKYDHPPYNKRVKLVTLFKY